MNSIANELTYSNGKANSSLVYNNKKQKAIMMAVSKSYSIKPHTSPTDAMAIVTEGEVVVMLNDENFTLKQGDSILFKKDEIHSLHPVTDFKMYLIKY